jgi:hypothetical protein
MIEKDEWHELDPFTGHIATCPCPREGLVYVGGKKHSVGFPEGSGHVQEGPVLQGDLILEAEVGSPLLWRDATDADIGILVEEYACVMRQIPELKPGRWSRWTGHKGQLRCRVRISGVCDGRTFLHEDPEDPEKWSQFIHAPDEPGKWPAPSHFWWAEGNMCCDCNRVRFVPWIEDKDHPCGDDRVHINSIMPFDKHLPSLNLNEKL